MWRYLLSLYRFIFKILKMEPGLGKKLLVSAIAFTAVVGGYLFWQNSQTSQMTVSPVDSAVSSVDSAVNSEHPESKEESPPISRVEELDQNQAGPPKMRQSENATYPRKRLARTASTWKPDRPRQTSPIASSDLDSEPRGPEDYSSMSEEPIPLRATPREEHPMAQGGGDLPFMQIWGGLGANYISFSEESNGGSDSGKFAKLSGPTVSVGVNVRFAEHHRGQFEYHDWPGTASADSSVQIDRKSYRWKNVLAEYQYIFSQNSENVFTALVGAQIHQVPFIIFNNDGSQTLSQNELRNLSLGVKWQRFTESGFEYSALARYQHTLDSGSTDGLNFKAKNGKIFDASLGVSRRFKNNMTFGFFWLAQYQKFNFDYSDSSIAASGDQSLFNSNFQIRIGYDFF
jgi:hypothetical protein